MLTHSLKLYRSAHTLFLSFPTYPFYVFTVDSFIIILVLQAYVANHKAVMDACL